MITQEYVQEFFHYDPETGIFTRKKKTGRSTVVGETVGSDKGNGYLFFCVQGKLFLSHRIAWLYVYGSFPEKNIDHINGNPKDNRISNLRLANQSQNTANSKLSKANTSGLKGVSFRKDTKKWQSQIMVNYKHKNLGCFETKEEAHTAYCQAATHYFGEYTKRQELKNL